MVSTKTSTTRCVVRCYDTRMRFPGSIGIARIAPFVAAFLLCLVVFLYPYQITQFVTEVIPSAVPMTHHSSPVDSGKPAGGHELAGNYLTAALEETEAENQRPVNAGYMTVLLLAVFFGIVLGVLGGRQMWRRQRIFLLSERPLIPVTGSPPRELAPPLLSVFLL